YRDSTGEIRGFMDGYIDNFENIYERELDFHFKKIGKLGLENYIENKLYKLTKNIFTISSLGIEEKSKNLFITFNIIKTFASVIDQKFDDLDGIFESIIGSNTYKIFLSMGANRIYVNKNNLELSNKDTDILIHKSLVKEYKTKFNVPVLQFLRENRMKML
ncbi:MAG: hypothetical protein PHR68_03990, partial [Candidatus Gracilibacteria bacterium]|nr:hypothetical protein [Candidatus Gracilibacteria bacterium]